MRKREKALPQTNSTHKQATLSCQVYCINVSVKNQKELGRQGRWLLYALIPITVRAKKAVGR